jgi:hypothetical protein
MEALRTALSMKHNGNQTLDPKERRSLVLEMQDYYADWKAAVAKLDYIGGQWWDENKVEERFGSQFFYYAHRKMRKAEEKVRDLHRKMFRLLTTTDGFSNIPFEPFFCTEAEQCYHEFMSKYNK